jgi:phosphoribosylaminoimidazole-succinocarboxamide synthase
MIEQLKTKNNYRDIITNSLSKCLTSTSLEQCTCFRGKVRDRYDLGKAFALITTDRQSAFDRILATIPFKGQVLNQTGAWWFEQTKDIIPNHVIDFPDPNVTIAKKCTPFPIEFVVRGFVTGSSSTSLWTIYEEGNREYCGIQFPDGMVKNQKLPKPVITPTTKEEEHDRAISPAEIIAEGWMEKEHWEYASKKAIDLFVRGQEISSKHGLILVDTKYEMGLDEKGEITLIDEIHTPDSSRYWIEKSFQKRLNNQKEPENIDKEFLRLWFKEHCDPYKDEKLPDAPIELVTELSARYIHLYEVITGEKFSFPDLTQNIEERIFNNLIPYLS